MPTGTVTKFVIDKGFGFVRPDDSGPDLFAPVRTLIGDKANIREGMRVNYEYKQDDKTQKPMCASWQPLDMVGGAPAGYPYGAPGAFPGMAPGGYSPYGVPPYGGMPPMNPYGAMPGAANGDRYSPYGAPAVALPAGWEQVMDANTNKPYYWNRVTNETSWTPPTAPATAAPPAGASPGVKLPEGWETATDPASGKPYYFNRASGATSWTPP